jgi:ABC-type bacteriocin/lantibiotic exporter with double-glycine peptidase domain
MILEMHGFPIAEEVLGEKCGTNEFGTSASELVHGASLLGFKAQKEYSTLEGLRSHLSQNIFPIIFINLLVIDGYNATHAVIVEQIFEAGIKVIDPRLGERVIALELFDYSWRRAKNVAVIVEKA